MVWVKVRVAKGLKFALLWRLSVSSILITIPSSLFNRRMIIHWVIWGYFSISPKNVFQLSCVVSFADLLLCETGSGLIGYTKTVAGRWEGPLVAWVEGESSSSSSSEENLRISRCT